MKTRKLGQYYFGRFYRDWAVFQVDFVSEDGRCSSGRFVKRVYTYEEAVRETWKLNGWGEPRYIRACA